MAQKRKLNRGLEALLGSGLLADSQGQADTAASEVGFKQGAPMSSRSKNCSEGLISPEGSLKQRHCRL